MVAARGKFKTRYEGLNQRRQCWVCLDCNTRFEKKSKQCPECFERNIQYFPSAAEANRYFELLFLVRCGEVTDIELQPRYPVVINGVKCFEYRADFKYRTRDGATVIEDVKGSEEYTTDVFQLKRTVVEAIYGITISIHSPVNKRRRSK